MTFVLLRAAQHIQVHTSAQGMAVLMVGVVAADLGAAWAAEQSGIRMVGKTRLKSLYALQGTSPSQLQTIRAV